MKIFKYIFTIIAATCLLACGGSDDGGDTNPDNGGNNPTNGGNNPIDGDDKPTDNTNIPTKATLVFPDNNKVCTTGIFLENSTDSKVTFEWNAATNAKKYLVTYTNTESNTTKTIESTSNTAEIVLNQNANYKWTITSINGDNKVVSDEWTFFNSAEGERNFAPFPAKLIVPENKAILTTTTGINLEWEASEDGDTSDSLSYVVYLGLNTNPTDIIVDTTTELTVALPTNLTAATTYYWKVVTKDTFGNETESQTFSFKTP